MPLRSMTPEVVDHYYESGVWQRHTLIELIADQAQRRPDVLAVADQHSRLTYGELVAQAGVIGTWLRAQGLQDGDVVAVQSSNSVHLPLMHVACNWAGLTFLPLTTAWRENEVRHLLRLSRARAIVVPTVKEPIDFLALAQGLRAELPDLRLIGTPEPVGADFDLGEIGAGPAASERPSHSPEDPRFIMVTSGTTDMPRLSEWTDNNLWFFMREYARAVEMVETDIALGLAPAGTGATGYVYPVLAPLLNGATSVLLEHWSTAEAFEVLEKERITITTAVPTQLVKMLQDERATSADLSALRVVTNAGAPLPAQTGPQVQETFACMLQTCYGASDGGVPVLTALRHTDEQRFHTVGQILPENELRLVDHELKDVPPGEVGEIVWRGPTKHLGYLHEPERTAAAFVGDGWYRSGDLGTLDEEGFLRIVGRVKDVIIRGGQNISPREVEDAVLSHPSVANVGVVGVPDPVYGERACACVVLRPGSQLTLEELLEHLASTGTPKHKWPERLEVFTDIPESAGGKQDKVSLRKRVLELD